MLELGAHTDYHLVLANELSYGESDAYEAFYKSVLGFKILDNGAAEGELIDNPHVLHDMARQIEAAEIVVPDEIGDASTTAFKVGEFERFALPEQFKYMAVLQGGSLPELSAMMQLYSGMPWISTIALPRHLLKTFGDDIRLHLARIISNETRFGKNNIHCLGAGSWVGEVRALAEQDLVRGMDTSLPVNYGLAGVRIGNAIQYDNPINRPDNFFGAAVARTSKTWEIIRANVTTYLEWAGYPRLFDGDAEIEEAP
jgi:hypothetical protein